MTLNDLSERIDKEIVKYTESDSYTPSIAIPPFSIEDLRNHIIFRLMKLVMDAKAEQRSVRTHRGNDEDYIRMKDSRTMKAIKEYRAEQQSKIYNEMGVVVHELSLGDMSSMEQKKAGYKLSDSQYFELQKLENLDRLYAALLKRSICDVKKVSIGEFKRLMSEYDKQMNSVLKLFEGNSADIIFASIELYALEKSLSIEYFYRIAEIMEKSGIEIRSTIDRSIKDLLLAMCGIVNIRDSNGRIIAKIEDKFVIQRINLIKYIFSKDMFLMDNGKRIGIGQNRFREWFRHKIEIFITVSSLVRRSIVEGEIIQDLSTNISDDEWADFLYRHYDVRTVYKPKAWTNKRIRYMRKVFDMFLEEAELSKK